MILPAYLIDADTHETVGTFGLEVDVPLGADIPWLPQRWALLRSYTLPAVGPGGHPWAHWGGALVMLLATFAVLLQGVSR